ncbi:MAG: 2-oxoacid:ferredoxin oxidoreductase subunit beta [Deltaproteobacteria bacterium]|nr:2-oxoacid:ferredoxin oxidoreductase subunit beta [Deltaproteobacteria bacterium]MBK9646479.1 2-oxoacid:ferredoxin oxidoreductase subunit beta [Deltaproteobacteria bacterium]
MSHPTESPIGLEAPITEDPPQLTKKDFMSDQTIRWCPGCGDYSILSQTQTVLAELGLPRENVAIVSGIGCSSRFPYYMNTYGFHTIHGRAPAVATGLKCVNPDLSVWMITGDGDALSIGGNHFIHLLRRNVDLQILLFNNRIYGLTKGQYSPTSEVGKKTKSTPMGSVDHPFDPVQLALGAGATFIARSADVLVKELRDVLKAAYHHKGSSFVEIYQNCNIFNDLAFEDLVARKVRDDRLIFLEHGKPMTFGVKDAPKGIRLHNLQLEVIDLAGGEFTEADCIVHDKHNPLLAGMLARMQPPNFPVPMGVLYETQRPCYEDGFNQQVTDAIEKQGPGDLTKLIHGSQSWVVK